MAKVNVPACAGRVSMLVAAAQAASAFGLAPIDCPSDYPLASDVLLSLAE